MSSARTKLAAYSATVGICLIWPQMLHAQVAPTEVNEQAVDDFGVDRKTGRFTWSSGEVVGAGGEGSRVSIVVTGVRSPAHAQSFMPARRYPVDTSEPQLTIAPFPASQPIFPGEINPNKNYVTVSYSGGSHTYECTPLACAPQFFHQNTLEPSGGGYIFKDTQGIEISFLPSSSTTVYPDGRVSKVLANGSKLNNLGFMLKVTGSSVQAVNQAADYCDADAATACASLSKVRSATLPASYVHPLVITNSAGEQLKLRWIEKTAKETRPPVGDGGIAAANIRNLTSNYPLGITLPGSTAEDITLSYNQIDPLYDTHDDIRVVSVTKNGVTADYEYNQYWPHGKFREVIDPPADNSGGGIEGYPVTGRLRNEYEQWQQYAQDRCDANPYAPECGAVGVNESGGGGGGIQIPQIEFEEAPPDEDAPLQGQGSQIYQLFIKTTIDGELQSESQSLRPYGDFGISRRRLLWIKDAFGRKTEPLHNHMDEFVGAIQPEGNLPVIQYDARGNVISSGIRPKPKPDGTYDPDIVSTYTYEPTCTAVTQARCNKPLTITDPKGNVTEYTYNDRGQVLTETKPAPTPGAARPTVVNEYTMRTAYIKDANGNPVAAGPAISLLTKSFTCISSANCSTSSPAADKVVTEYDYGPTTGLNNLLLRGMSVTAANELGQIETLRTCYGYNYFGERISETQPRADLSVCP